jgi:hypothetical protein
MEGLPLHAADDLRNRAQAWYLLFLKLQLG